MGLLAGINALRKLQGKPLITPPEETAIGALIKYLTSANPKHFQPMNVNWGLFPLLPKTLRKLPKKEKWLKLSERALNSLKRWKSEALQERE